MQHLHLLVRELEIKDLRILLDPTGRDRLGERYKALKKWSDKPMNTEYKGEQGPTFCKLQRIITCAGDLPYFFPISASKGSFIRVP
jgi:hypothetical protein